MHYHCDCTVQDGDGVKLANWAIKRRNNRSRVVYREARMVRAQRFTFVSKDMALFDTDTNSSPRGIIGFEF